MKNHGIFESVEFLNEEKFYAVEISLLDESTLILNEGLKYIKKDDVPNEFKDEALKVCEYLEKEFEKGATDEESLGGAFGARNAKKKISEGKPKNAYLIGFNYADVGKKLDDGMKASDMIFVKRKKRVIEYAPKVALALGYKKINEEAKKKYIFIKEGKDCIYAMDVYIYMHRVVFQLRCVEDTDENREYLANAKEQWYEK